MRIVRDENKVARKKRIGQITSLVGIGILIGGMAFTWFAPNLELAPQLVLVIPIVALLLGFMLSQVGLYFTNRWVRSPRPDELVDQSLKGLGQDYVLYHYALPAPHLLLTPSGLLALVTRTEGGEYSVDGDKWRHKVTALRILGFMGREGLGNPTKDAHYQVARMSQLLENEAPELAQVPVNAAVVFLADGVTLNLGETSVPVLRAAKIKGFLRSQGDKPLPRKTQTELVEFLDTQVG